MLYIRNNIFRMRFSTRPVFGIQIVGFVDGNILIKKLGYSQDISGKLYYVIPEHMNRKEIFKIKFSIIDRIYGKNLVDGILNYNKENYENNMIDGEFVYNGEDYENDMIDGILYLNKYIYESNDGIKCKLVYEKSDYKNNFINGILINNENEYKNEKDNIINVNLNLDKDIYKNSHLLDGILIYNNAEFKRDIYGILINNENEYGNNVIDGNLNLIEDRYKNDVIDGIYMHDYIEYKNNVINGRFIYQGMDYNRVMIYGELKYNGEIYGKDINVELLYCEEEYKDEKERNVIDGRLVYNEGEYENDVINGNLNLKEDRYKNDVIDGIYVCNAVEIENDVIDGRLVYNEGSSQFDLVECVLYLRDEENRTDIDGTVINNGYEYENNVIDGRFIYQDNGYLVKDFNVLIQNVNIDKYEKDINVFIQNYEIGKEKKDIDVYAYIRNNEYKRNLIDGEFSYSGGEYEKNVIDGSFYYVGKSSYEGKCVDGYLNLEYKKYKSDIDGVILNYEKSEINKDLDVHLNLIEKSYYAIYPLIRFKIKPKCYDNSHLFINFNTMGERNRDICGRVYLKENENKYNIDGILNLELSEYENNNDKDARGYVIPWDGEVYSNEILVTIRNVENDNIMEKCESEISCSVSVKEEEFYKSDIDCIINIPYVLNDNEMMMNVYKDNEYKINICMYYKDGYCYMGDKIKLCDNEFISGKKKIINNIKTKKIKFEEECPYYELCGHCISEYEKRIRNVKRKYEIIKSGLREKEQNLYDIIIEENMRKINVLGNNVIGYKEENYKINTGKYELNDYYMKKYDDKIICKDIDCVLNLKDNKKENERIINEINVNIEKMKIIIFVDPLWRVEPYVFKSSLITVLERYYNKCDMYVVYGGNPRTDYDITNLCLNYKIDIRKLKRIEINGNDMLHIRNQINNFINISMSGNIPIGRVYLFMNDPINYMNHGYMNIIANVCKKLNISCVCIGTGGEYIEVLDIDKIKDRYVRNMMIEKRHQYHLGKYAIMDIDMNDPNRITY